MSSNFINDFRTNYEPAINAAFQVRGTIKQLVTTGTDVKGERHQVSLLSNKKGYIRYGSELPQPTNTHTKQVWLDFETVEKSEFLSEIEINKLDDESFRSIIVENQARYIVGRYEYNISRCVYDVPVIRSRDFRVSNPFLIENSMQIMGDGSDAVDANNLTESDLKPFSVKCLTRISMIKNQLGILNSEMFVVLSPGAMAILLEDEKFTSSLYSGTTTPLLKDIESYNYMGLNILVAQSNMDDVEDITESYRSYCGLKLGRVNTTDYVTCFAFTRPSIYLLTNGLQSVTEMDIQRGDSLFLRTKSTLGSVVRMPNQVIQIVTTSIEG
jgi:Phage capsid protein